MEKSFLYSESARRKAKKIKALEDGVVEQSTLVRAKQARKNIVREHRPPHPVQNRAVVKTTIRAPLAVAASSNPSRPLSAQARSVISAPAKVPPPSLIRPARAQVTRLKAKDALPLPPRAAPPLPPPKLKASHERLLLESKDLDLFNTGRTGKPAVCPDCHHELLKVVCLGTAVRVCLDCKGTWFPYSVVRDFAQDIEWFQQLGPAVQMAIAKKAPAK